VADSLDPEAPGIITVTIREESGGKPDVEGLQRDLDRLGVRARIYQGDPSCPVSRQVAGDDIGHDPDGYLVLEVFSASEVVDGGQVAHINPDKIPTGHHLQIVFPVLAEGEGYDGGVAIGLEKDPGPDRVHMPAPGARLEDYVLDEDGLTRWRPPAQAWSRRFLLQVTGLVSVEEVVGVEFGEGGWEGAAELGPVERGLCIGDRHEAER
jgi:hypothetical protein